MDIPNWSMQQVRTNGFKSLEHWERVKQSDHGGTEDISEGEEFFSL